MEQLFREEIKRHEESRLSAGRGSTEEDEEETPTWREWLSWQ